MLSVLSGAEAFPVRRGPIGVESLAGSALRDSIAATPDSPHPDPTNQPLAPNGSLATAGGSAAALRVPPAAERRHRHAGATLRLRKPSLASGSPGTPQRVPGRRRRGQRPGTGGRTPTAQPRSARAGAPPGRPATLSPFKPTPAYPAWPLPVQSIICPASPRYPLPHPHPTPASLCPAPSASPSCR